MVKIEFFQDGKSLGIFDCKELSHHEDRDEIAKANGILSYDKVVLDDGRITMTKDISSYTANDGSIWKIKTKVK